MGNPPVKLLDKVRQCIRLKGYSIRTEKSYASWIKRFILFHGKRHPQDMGKPEIEAFLSNLVMTRNVASSTQNQAFNAILFLYNHVLDVDMPEDINALRSKKPLRVPTVMTREETLKLIGVMRGTHQLMTKLIYGCGLRGYGRVYLPNALAKKYPNAARQWGWQYAFPAKTLSKDPRSGMKRRHHLHVSGIQKAVRKAVNLSAIVKPVGCHSLRHSGVYPPLADHPPAGRGL